MQDLTIQDVSLYSHLVEVLCFFVRQHAYRSKYFLLAENLAARIAQLLSCPEKHLKLSALKYFRTCVGLHDQFHNRQIVNNNVMEPILDIVFETMPRDNLLNSACLEFFEFINRENMKDLTMHVVSKYRERLEQITYVNTFRALIDKADKYMATPPAESVSFASVETEQAPNRGIVNGGQRWQGLKDADAQEEAYFNGSDNDDDDEESFSSVLKPISNGASPLKPLVDYPDDEDDNMDILAQDPSPDQPRETTESPNMSQTQPLTLERLAEKRRREEDEEDELGKLTTQTKRRSSSVGSAGGSASTHGQTLRRKKSISSGKDGPPKKISISLAVKSGGGSAESE